MLYSVMMHFLMRTSGTATAWLGNRLLVSFAQG